MIGQTISHYRIEAELGHGGMGAVYLARDTRLDRQVALKFLSTELSKDHAAALRFRREGQAAARLNHPHVATVHDVGEHEGRPFLVFEYVEGETLRQRLRRAPMALEELLCLAQSLAEALAHAHEHGIVHRDIKSANIMLTRSAEPKILDFGLARLEEGTAITSMGTTMGTLEYMSPEQLRGEPTDARSDLWSLGCVLYECLVGKPPFPAESVEATRSRILHEDPAPPTALRSGIPLELEQTVLRCLEKDASLRYQHADDLAAKLRSIRAHGSDPVTLAAGAGPPPSRRRWPIVLGALLMLSVVAIGLRLRIDSETGPSPAQASPDMLAVLYFENLVDPPDEARLGEIATNLLITDLSESSYLRVLSSQRLYDILRLQGKEGIRVIDRGTAGEIARRAGARRMLLGSILRIDPALAMTSQLVDVATGEILASQRVEGRPGDDVFTVIDRLSASVREDLRLPAAARGESDAPVASMTTGSIAAYRLYLQGLEEQKGHHWLQAMEYYQRAVDNDSTFAMAWLKLSEWGSVYTATREAQEVRSALAAALRHVDQAGWKERHFIRARSAWMNGDRAGAIREWQAILERDPDEKRAHYALGIHLTDLEKSIHHFRRVIEIDPLDWEGTNQLAYRYMRIRDRQNALASVERYLALAPGEPNPWDSRGEIYAAFGAVDSALVSYRRAYRLDPEFYTSQLSNALVLIFAGRYEEARRTIESLLTSERPEVRSFARFHLATAPFIRGRLEEGIAILERGLAQDEEEEIGRIWPALGKRAIIGLARLRQGRMEQGLALCDEAMEIVRTSESWNSIPAGLYYCTALTQAGRYEQAEAEIQRMEATIRRLRPDLSGPADLARALLALNRHEGPEAERWAQQAVENGAQRWISRYVLALARLDQGHAREAARELEDLRIMYVRHQIHTPFLPAELRYHCARAWDEAEEPGRALERYEEFLTLWENADPGIRLGIADPRDPQNDPRAFAARRREALSTPR